MDAHGRVQRRRHVNDHAKSGQLAREAEEQRGACLPIRFKSIPFDLPVVTCAARVQVLIERRLRWVRRKLQEGDDEGLQVANPAEILL